MSATVDAEYWKKRTVYDATIRAMFCEDFPEFSHYQLKVCVNGSVLVSTRSAMPSIFRGYPAFKHYDPNLEKETL